MKVKLVYLKPDISQIHQALIHEYVFLRKSDIDWYQLSLIVINFH